MPGTCITCVLVHVAGTFYLGHLATKLDVHITQMPHKFCIDLGHLCGHQGCFCQMFCTSPGHGLDLYISVAYFIQRFSRQFICGHPADAPEILHFPRTSIGT